MQDDQATSFTDFDRLVKYGSLPKDKLLLLIRFQAEALELVWLNARSAKDDFLRPAIIDTLDDLREDEKSLMPARLLCSSCLRPVCEHHAVPVRPP